MRPPAWLQPALNYLPQWLSHQMLITEQPGCAVAVAWQGEVVFEAAFGHADLTRKKPLTPRHRFRVASHSKTFTTVGVMRLREQGHWRLDDPVGRYVSGLHSDVAKVTLAQLASHSAGVVRDGADAGQWSLRQPFLSQQALRADVAQGLALEAGTRFKYSNHGYGLLGLAIEAVAGEPFDHWIAREVVATSGLQHTVPDAQHLPSRGAPMALGHSAKHPLGQRVALPAAMSTHALASATGFVSTAGDLARFYGSLSPLSKKSVLSPASRREMARRLWASEHDSTGRWYGLGTISGSIKGAAGEWQHFGHSGGFPGQITRTACVPSQGLAVSVLTNAADGLSHQWLDGALQVLQTFAHHGAPNSKKHADWQGRYWNLWGAFDLLPVAGHRVLVANPGLLNPMLDASQIEPQRKDVGRICLAGGFAFHGEPARLERDAKGAVKALWLGGMRLTAPQDVARSLQKIRA
jgi:D-alanyl-D-alanine carboxypeptidase